MPAVACPLCGRRVRVPRQLAGRQVVCPGCNEIIPGPAAQEAEAAVPAADPAAEDGANPSTPRLPLAARLGIASLSLGVASVMVLCLPFIGYMALGLSSVGLMLGLAGLYRAAVTAHAGPPSHTTGARKASVPFGQGRWDYPLAGVGACLLALILVVWPFLGR
jgi:hypothetical protein